ncbi:MAG: ABC transporter permease [Burkholderiales bacterium]|nr:MAG: ABC transporter permease [Burkholderiales bacterium]
MGGMVRALWEYRAFIIGSVLREFQSKYRRSLLGAAWSVLNPLALILVYTLIFANVMKARLPGVESTYGYSIHLCAGILTWGLFSEITGRAQTVFIENASLLKKLSFPRLCLPAVVVLSAGLNFAIVFGLFLVFLIITGNFPGWPILALIPMLAIEVAFAIGLGICLGVFNVFFRDVGQGFAVVLQFWFWLTPIVYPLSVIPESWRSVVELNPMARLVLGYQDVFVRGVWPNWVNLWPVLTLAAIACVLGFALFRRRSGELVDEL